MTGPPWSRGRRAPWLLAGLAYLILSLAVTWPLLLSFRTEVLGYLGFENTAQTLWLYHAWKAYQLDLFEHFVSRHGLLGSLLRLEEIYRISVAFPEKNSVANGLDFLWTWPLEALFGLPGYYNVKAWLVLTANGLAAMLVCRRAGASLAPAWVGGALFAFNPLPLYLLVTGRMIEAQLFLPTLYVAALTQAWRDPRPLPWALAGAALALTTANYWFYGHFMLVFTGVWLLWHLARRRPPRLGPWGRNGILAGLTCLVLVLPAAHPYLVRLAAGQRLPGMVRPDPGDQPNLLRQLRQMTSFSADLDYGLRQPPRAPRDEWNPPWWIPWQNCFLLNGTLLALVPGVLFRHGGFWMAGLGLFYLLPLGPFLKVEGSVLRPWGEPLGLPYLHLLQGLPTLEKLFWPNQSMLLFALCASVMVALNLDRLIRQRRIQRRQLALLILTLLTVGATELSMREQLPLPTTRLTTPPPYLTEGRGQGHLYLPMGRRYWESPRDFNRDYYHGSDLTLVDLHLALHGGKGLWGRPHYLASRDYWLYEPTCLSNQPFLKWLVALGEDRALPPFQAEDLAQVIGEGYRYLVVSERLCAHIQDRGSYLVDLTRGRARYEALCRLLEDRFGPPIHAGEERSWDQGIRPGRIVEHAFGITIFELREGGGPSQAANLSPQGP